MTGVKAVSLVLGSVIAGGAPEESVPLQRPASLEAPPPAEAPPPPDLELPRDEVPAEPVETAEPVEPVEASPEPVDAEPAESPQPAEAPEPEGALQPMFADSPDAEPAAVGPAEPGDTAIQQVRYTSAEIEAHERDLHRAKLMIAGGSISAITSVLLFIGAGVEGSKPDCDFGLDDCADAPRKSVARGLGAAGGILLAGGTALIAVGAVRLKRLRAQPIFNGQHAGVALSGRF